jgi:hypothetical protein
LPALFKYLSQTSTAPKKMLKNKAPLNFWARFTEHLENFYGVLSELKMSPFSAKST